MTALLAGCYAVVGALWLWAFARDPRRGVLMALVFCAFCTEALPVRVVPVRGLAPMGLAAAIGLVFMWWIARPKEAAPRPVAPSPYAALLVFFWLMIAAELLMVSWTGYGEFKVQWFFIKVVLPLAALRLLAPFDADDLRAVFDALLAGAVLVTLNLALLGIPIAMGRAYDGEINPITLGRIVAQGAFLALAVACFEMLRRPRMALAYLAVGAMLIGMVALNGERGPLLAIGVGLAAMFVLTRQAWRGRASALLVGGAAGSAALLATQAGAMAGHAGLARVVNNFSSLGENTSDAGRLGYMEVAWRGFMDSQGLGVGTGGFPVLLGVVQREYPHNLFMEVAVEHGIPGLVLLALLLGLTLHRLWRCAAHVGADVRPAAVLCVWCYALTNAMVSSDVVGNAPVWLTGAIMAYVALPASDEAPDAGEEEGPYAAHVHQPG